jgi:5'-nucleotidase
MEQTAAAPVDPAPVASSKRTSSHAAPRTAHGVSAASATGARYTIKKGDSLWKIAQAKYGDGNRWKKIANANPQIDPNNIKAGQTITIP